MKKKKFLGIFFKKSIVNRLIDSLPGVSFHVVPTTSAGV